MKDERGGARGQGDGAKSGHGPFVGHGMDMGYY